MAESLAKKKERLIQQQQRAKKLEKEISNVDRKQETQKLVILGRFLLELRKRKIVDDETFYRNFDQFLTRNHDREIFGFPLLPEQPKQKKSKSSSKSLDVQDIIDIIKATQSPSPAPKKQQEIRTPPTTHTEKQPTPVQPEFLKETVVHAEEFMGI